jgi:hypothetical protein
MVLCTGAPGFETFTFILFIAPTFNVAAKRKEERISFFILKNN